MSWWCGASQKMLSYSVASFFSSKAVLLSLHLVWFDHSVELDILNRGHFGQRRLKYLPFGLCGESLWPLILNKILIFFLLLWQIPWPIAICGEKKPVSFPLHVSSLVTVHDWAKSGQKLWKNAFYWLVFWVMLNYFSCTAPIHLLGDGATPSGLGPAISFNNQENAPQKWMQVNLT